MSMPFPFQENSLHLHVWCLRVKIVVNAQLSSGLGDNISQARQGLVTQECTKEQDVLCADSMDIMRTTATTTPETQGLYCLYCANHLRIIWYFA